MGPLELLLAYYGNPNLASQGRRYRNEFPQLEGIQADSPEQVAADAHWIAQINPSVEVQLARDRRRLELLRQEQASGSKNPKLPKEIQYTEAKLASGNPWLRVPVGYSEGGSITDRLNALLKRAQGGPINAP